MLFTLQGVKQSFFVFNIWLSAWTVILPRWFQFFISVVTLKLVQFYNCLMLCSADDKETAGDLPKDQLSESQNPAFFSADDKETVNQSETVVKVFFEGMCMLFQCRTGGPILALLNHVMSNSHMHNH